MDANAEIKIIPKPSLLYDITCHHPRVVVGMHECSAGLPLEASTFGLPIINRWFAKVKLPCHMNKKRESVNNWQSALKGGIHMRASIWQM